MYICVFTPDIQQSFLLIPYELCGRGGPVIRKLRLINLQWGSFNFLRLTDFFLCFNIPTILGSPLTLQVHYDLGGTVIQHIRKIILNFKDGLWICSWKIYIFLFFFFSYISFFFVHTSLCYISHRLSLNFFNIWSIYKPYKAEDVIEL